MKAKLAACTLWALISGWGTQIAWGEPTPLDPFNGGQGQGQPINPGIPTSPEDFGDDSGGVPPEEFGFSPPTTNGEIPSYPPMNNTYEQPTPSSPPPTVNSPTPTVSRPSRSLVQPSQPSGPTLGKNPLAKGAKKGGPPAPKLADYLQLDPAVRGLEVKNFDLPDKDIKDVVTLISKWTGKNFILDSKLRGKITIIGPGQVTLQEAYQAFLSSLEANNLTTVQSGKFIRIIDSADARRAPVKTFVGDVAPNDDQYITRIFQLKYINADEVQREFRDMVTRNGRLFAYEPTNSIIITDTGSNIQRIKDILEALDVKSFETTLHLLKIKNTSAKSIADMLGAMYGDVRGGNASSANRSFRRSALERTRGGGVISKIVPDEQTNSLVVLANLAGFQTLVRLVQKLDIKVTDTGRIHVYYCEYAKAEDLAQTLASLSSGSPKSSGSRPSPVGGGGSSPSPAPSAAPTTAELEGGVRVTADASTNSLVITANSSDYKTLRQVIKKLDIPRQQVFIETAILDMSLTKSDNWTPNIALGRSTGLGGGFIADSTAATKALSGGIPDGGYFPFFAGENFWAMVGNVQIPLSTINGVVSFLTQNTQTSVLSTPQIIALDNGEAVFKVQDEIPVSSGTVLNAAATNPAAATVTDNITYKKVGISIKIKPHVNISTRTVRLEIEQEVENINKEQLPEGLKGKQVATTNRTTNTQVSVKDKNFVMLGGLMSDKIDEIVKKVPLLGDIPIIGWLFKSKTWEKRKSNLVILLRPRIIGTTLEAADVINEKLKKRDDFIEQNFSGEERHTEAVAELKSQLKVQKDRGSAETPFDYKNIESEEEDAPSEKEKPKPSPTAPPALPEATPPKSEGKSE